MSRVLVSSVVVHTEQALFTCPYPKSTPPGTGQAASQTLQLLHRLRPDQTHSAAAPALHAGCSSGGPVFSIDLTGVSVLLLAWWGEYICVCVCMYVYICIYIYIYTCICIYMYVYVYVCICERKNPLI